MQTAFAWLVYSLGLASGDCASKQAASLFIRTGHGQGDKADHDVRLLLCGLWVARQPRLPFGRHSSGTRSRDGRQPSVATSHLMGRTGPIDGAGPPSLPGRRAAARKGTCPCPPESMARSYGRLVWARLLSRGSCVLVDRDGQTAWAPSFGTTLGPTRRLAPSSIHAACGAMVQSSLNNFSCVEGGRRLEDSSCKTARDKEKGGRSHFNFGQSLASVSARVLGQMLQFRGRASRAP